jgi:hypothetical protein
MKLESLFGWLRWLNPLRLFRRRRREQSRPQAQKPVALKTSEQPQTALVRHQLRVLIVESDLSCVRAWTEMFRHLGHEVQSTTVLNKAYVLSSQWKPHLIVYGNLAHTDQWWFAHAVLGNDKRGLMDPPLPDTPYLVRLCDQWLQVECVYSYEFGFDVCEGRQVIPDQCMRWCESTREMLRSR